MSENKKGITLYSHKSGPNGWKVATILEELQIPYSTIWIDFRKGDQKDSNFLRICPNGRIPAIVDHNNDDFAVWESDAILLYLVRRYDESPNPRLWSSDFNEQSDIISWLFFQASGHGVILGQAFWFKYFHNEKLPSATRRYVDEARRIYGVLEVKLSQVREDLNADSSNNNSMDDGENNANDSENHSSDSEQVWLVGNKCTVADLSFLSWTLAINGLNIDIAEEFPEVNKWVDAMLQRPGTEILRQAEDKPLVDLKHN